MKEFKRSVTYDREENGEMNGEENGEENREVNGRRVSMNEEGREEW
jgi:hypothetical protein